MTSFKLSGLLSDAVGKLGGSTFTRNRSGIYMRQWRTPINPRSAAQQSARALLTQVSQHWATMDSADRDKWEDAASKLTWTNRFGDPYSPSGFDLFCMCNINCLTAGGSIFDDAPSSFSCIIPSSLSFTFAGAHLNMTPDPEQAFHTTGFLVYATPGLRSSINYVNRQFRLIAFVPKDSSWPYDLYTAYRDVFSIPAQDEKVHLRIKPLDSVNFYSQPLFTASCIYSNP